MTVNKTRRFSAMWNTTTAMACVLILTACGGGGGGGSSDSVAAGPASPVGALPPATGNTTTITGAVTKGPVSGATLELFDIDTFGQPIGAAVATGSTTADGNFSVSVPANSGTLLVVSSGGSFIDESDQEPDIALKRRIQLADNQTFLSLLPQGQTAVAVTPITTALVLRGRILGGPDGSFLAKFNASKTVLDTQAGFDVLATIPANPVAPAATATEAQKQYALLLGGLANLVNNVAVQLGASAPTYDMVVAVTFDLVDGQFDGLSFGQASVPGPVLLPTNLDFDAEVTRFRNNNFDNFSATVVPSIEVTTFANNAPTANAGVDATAPQNTAVQLDGSASTDPDSGVFYSWVQTAGTTVTLDNPAAASPAFTAPQRLVANETLTFELTAIDTIGLTSVDTVDVQVVGAIPATFYVVSNEVDDSGVSVGVDLDGGGKVTLNPDGTGALLDDIGSVPFNYTAVANVLTLTFLTPFLIDDHDEFFDVDGDGNFDDQFLVEERVDFFELTLTADTPNGDIFNLRESGNRTFTPIAADDTKAPEAYEFNEAVTAYDPAQAVPFAFADGAQRTLVVNAFSVISTLDFDDELYQDIFTFSSDGTGSTVNTAINFTYTIDAAGSLNVVFANGESAKYINLVTRASGDVVVAEYTLTTPLVVGDDAFIADIRLSLPRNTAAPLPVTRADVAGIYSGSIYDDDIPDANLDLRLNPDGTGSLQFDSIASRFFLFDFDEVIVFRSNFGVCWDVDAAGEIEVNRSFSLNTFPNTFSSETTPAFCAALTEETTGFQFKLSQFDNDGTTFKHFSRVSFNRCIGIATADCAQSPVLDNTNFGLRITTREAFNATPPVAGIDAAQTPDGVAVTVDVLVNDVARDLAIDPTTVTIVKGPFFGSATVNPTTGQITYTPNVGITQDVVQYFVRDTGGNRSQVVGVEVVINPCAVINGQRGFFDRFTGDCDYSGVTGAANVATSDVNFGPLPLGGVHKLNDSLFIGVDYATNAALTGAGISQGGDGPSLNIAAGSVLAFANTDNVISVRRGAQINVGGTITNPVIMTSQTDIDSKRTVDGGGIGFQPFDASGQWGGLVIHGFGVTNGCNYTGTVAGADLALSGECHLLSDSAVGTYGGNNNADSSGAINYLQVKHAGGTVNGNAADAGGFGLFAVGAGTAISNIEVYSSTGSGLVLVAGGANVQNYIGLYARDTAVAIDEGYQGSISSALLIQGEFSGNDCLIAGGVVDADILSPAQISAVIAQGINSRPVLTNITCVVSATVFDSGRGLNFFDGAFGTLADTIVTVPGADNGATLNYCIGSEDRSLQAVQDGDLTITGNLFACPDKTDGEILPNSTPLDAFLTASGSQFTTTLTSGASNPPPVAGTSNVLLEGAPLIYAVPQASLQIDGSPTTVTPTGTFIGAVQQGAGDWTLNWTFGLHPGLRQVPLWYEAPILVTPGVLRQSKGQIVTLDATQSVSASGPITYQWAQTTGTSVTLSDPTVAAPTLTAPGAGTNLATPGGVLEFSVTGTDANGLQSQRQVRVEVDGSIPLESEFFSVAESVIANAFGNLIEGGQRIVVNSDNTGTYTFDAGAQSFAWTDTPTTFTMDFSGIGGLVSGPFSESRNLGTPPAAKQVDVTRRVNSIVYTLVSDTGPKKLFTKTNVGVNQPFNVTDNVALPDEPFSEPVTATTESVVAKDDALPFSIALGDIFTLAVDLLPAQTSLALPGGLNGDELTFITSTTGTSRLKGETFTYNFDGNNLMVNFANGDIAEYTRLFNSVSGDVTGVSYARANTILSVTAFSSVKNDPATNWNAATLAGIYVTDGRTELNDGTFQRVKSFYRLHPEGTGQMEGESYDLATGQLSAIASSSLGICWEVDANGDLVINRMQPTSTIDQRFTGSRVPSVSTCSLVTNTASPDNTQIFIARTNRLLEVSGSRVRTLLESRLNECNSGVTPCDNTLLVLRGVGGRAFDPVTPFNGNPPLAVPDAISASGGLLAGSPVHSNDLAGDSAIVPTSVTIVAGPTNGTASVDVPTGDILYTSNGGFTGTDTIYYRVQDVNGNSSTIGTLTITVF